MYLTALGLIALLFLVLSSHKLILLWIGNSQTRALNSDPLRLADALRTIGTACIQASLMGSVGTIYTATMSGASALSIAVLVSIMAFTAIVGLHLISRSTRKLST